MSPCSARAMRRTRCDSASWSSKRTARDNPCTASGQLGTSRAEGCQRGVAGQGALLPSRDMGIDARSAWKGPLLALVAIAGTLLLVTVGWMGWSLSRPLPSDAVLRSRFHDHRAELDRLAAIAQADTHLVGAGHDPWLMRFTVYVHDTPAFDRMLSDHEVRATGRAELLRLLDRAGLPSVGRSRDGGTVWFAVRSRWGVRKGIVFSERPLSPTRPSLDGLERDLASGVPPAYVVLAPRWYVFLMPRD